MTRVVLVCGAGVSGTFLARRIREIEPTLSPVVTAIDSAASVLPGADVVLVAPQVAAELEHITRMAPGVPVAVLSPSAFTDTGAEVAVRTVRELMTASAAPYRVATPTQTKE